MKVFIADDDRDLVELFVMLLEDRGHEVITAFNGEQAVKLARQQDFDIAFLDVRMPLQNGVETLRQIRRFKPDARVVIMTGYSVEDLLEEALSEGAETILHKPIDLPEVLHLLAPRPERA